MALNFSFKRGKKNAVAGEAPTESSTASTAQEAHIAPQAEHMPPKKRRGLSLKLPKVTIGKPSSEETAKGDPQPSKTKKQKLPATRKTNSFVLMIGDDGAILVYIEKGKVMRRLYAPSAEKQHIKPIRDLLIAHPKVPVTILCDMIDQSYVRHTLPPVSSLSIQKLVKRRLNRDFAPEDIKGSLPMGREKTGRKEWNFLLISLANSDALQQWVDPILEMPNRCKGLHLVPVECQGFVKNLAQALNATGSSMDSEWKILVSHDKVGGFRQVVLKEGLLIFTRLTHMPQDVSVEVMAGNVEQEVQNTIEYLRRMSFSEDAGLDVYIITAQDVRDLLEPQRMGATQVKTFTPFEVSKLLNLPQAALSGDRFADVVLSANFALRQKPVLKLFTIYAKKLDQIYQASMGIKALGILASLYIVYSSAMLALGWQAAGSETVHQNTQLTSAQSQLRDSQRRYELLGDDQTTIMRVAALFNQTQKVKESPLNFVEAFGELKTANIRVRDWSWQPYVAELNEQQNANRAPASSNAANALYAIEARIEVLNHNGDTRELSRLVIALMEQIGDAFPAYDISRTMLPEEKKEASRTDTVLIDLNAPVREESYELQPGDEFVTIMLIGPKPEKEGAAS